MPEIIFANDDWIAVANLDSTARIVTNRIPGAAAGVRVNTAETLDAERSE